MNEEVVDATRFHGNFPIFWRHSLDLPINIDSHHSRLHAEVLGLELMEMGWWAFRPIGAIDQLAQIVGNRAFDSVAISLAEKKTSSGWGLEKFRRQETTEPIGILALANTCGSYFNEKLLDDLRLASGIVVRHKRHTDR